MEHYHEKETARSVSRRPHPKNLEGLNSPDEFLECSTVEEGEGIEPYCDAAHGVQARFASIGGTFLAGGILPSSDCSIQTVGP